MTEIIDQKNFEKLFIELKNFAKSIDFNELEKMKVLKKVGAWYQILDINKLPIHARLKVSEFQHSSNGLKVKFYKELKFEKILKKLEHLHK